MTNIKLVSIDMDGTLLNDDLDITQKTNGILLECDQKGIHVVLATGRTFTAANYYARALNLESPLITYNGGLIKTSKTRQVLLQENVDRKIAQDLLYEAETLGIYSKAYVEDTLLCPYDSNEAKEFSKKHRIPYQVIGPLSQNVTDAPNMLAFLSSDENHIEKMKKILDKKKYAENVSYTLSTPNSLEVMNRNISKGAALEHLCSHLNIDLKDTLAIGNSLNDLSMLQRAGRGIAMKNSDEQLLQYWKDRSCYDHNHDGVYYILREYV